MLMLITGVVPERDKIQFRTLGDASGDGAGSFTGSADGAFLGYTFGNMLRGKGFRVLADSEKLPIPYQGSGVIARRSFMVSSPAVLWTMFCAHCWKARRLSAIRKTKCR